jgi:GNAT superfamily N-acetyltransferase
MMCDSGRRMPAMRPPWRDCTPTAGGGTIGARTPTPSSTDPQARTIVAELGGEIVGLAHTELGENADWGALLDNLHVSYGLKGLGIGTRLMALTAQAVLDSTPGSGLYLWVLEQNAAARAFYTARGGTCVETCAESAPGGDPSRLDGTVMCLRFVWPEPSKLVATAG